MSIKKYEYIKGTREEIREYLEKELKIEPAGNRNFPLRNVTGIRRFYVSDEQSFEKQVSDKCGFTMFFYLEADGDAEWFAQEADKDGNMQTVPSVKLTIVKIDLFITDE